MAHRNTANLDDGLLRIISGADGSELFTSTDIDDRLGFIKDPAGPGVPQEEGGETSTGNGLERQGKQKGVSQQRFVI